MKLADKRAAWAIELRAEAIKATAAERQFKNLKADIAASRENDPIAERVAKVEAAVKKLEAADKGGALCNCNCYRSVGSNRHRR